MKIASWNVNSIQARGLHLVDWLKKHNPDFCLLQELKCEEHKFPHSLIGDLGYNLAISGQKSYNGVAILSKTPIEEINVSFADDPGSKQSRYIEIVSTYQRKVFRIASVYVPNGQDLNSDKFTYKLAFLKALKAHFAQLLGYAENLIIGGDFNIAPENIDVFDPVSLAETICFSTIERKIYREIENLGLTDAFRLLNPNSKQYTWWDYRAGGYQHNKGMRIDHFLLSPEALNLLKSCQVDEQPRSANRPSDHAPIYCELTP